MPSFLYARQIRAWQSGQGTLVSVGCFTAPSCSVSKAFEKSTNTMLRCIFCSMHFYCICHEKILFVVPRFEQIPRNTSGRKSSARLDSLLNSIQANTFPGIERNKIPQLFPQSHLSPFLKMMTSWLFFQSTGTSKFSQASFMMV